MFVERKDPRGGSYQSNRPKREFLSQTLSARTQLINSLFKELMYQILEKIQNEPYFKWPNKMNGDASQRNQSLYCHYHRDKGHSTEECRTLRDYLNQLVRSGKLNQFLHQPRGQFGHFGAKLQRGNVPRPTLGTINVIFAKLGGDLRACPSAIPVSGGFDEEVVKAKNHVAKRVKGLATPTLGFSEEDKEGICQPHDDALVVYYPNRWI